MAGFDKTEWYRDLGLLLAVGIGIFVGNVNGYYAGEEGRNMFGMLAGSAAGSAFSIGAFYLWHVYRAKQRLKILRESTTEVTLEVLRGMLDGSSQGWRFYDSHDGLEFIAQVLDKNFLSAVREGRISFVSGITIHATVLTTATGRSVLEVQDVFLPEKAS